jgi:hypothetical protein
VLAGIIKDSLLITSFVLITMLIIEYFTVQTKGNWIHRLKQNSWMQLVLAAFLGVLPGCFGAFTAVSLFTHGIINFAGLVTAMIAATGDEAFVMIAMIPGSAFKVFAIVFIIGILAGLIINLFVKNKKPIFPTFDHLKIHQDEPEYHLFREIHIWKQFRTMSFQKILLLIIGFLFLTSFFIGIFELDSVFEVIIFSGVTVIGLFIIIIVPDHFLVEHIWGHIFKKHLLRIFLWTFGALLFIHLFKGYLNLDSWIKSNQLIILMIAVLIGIIPESGPHIVFITLFAQGIIPLSTLVANSIVQDGHGALPLLAESKRSFFALKATNICIGFLIGISGYFFGW